MELVETAWSDLVPGAYVVDSEGTPWKLLEEHPTLKGTYRATSAGGDTAIVSDPGKPVRAWLPTHEEAMSHLERMLGARAEEYTGADPAPRSPADLKGHLKALHNQYTEPRMSLAEMQRAHTYLHAQAEYTIPHNHKDLR